MTRHRNIPGTAVWTLALGFLVPLGTQAQSYAGEDLRPSAHSPQVLF